MGEMKKAIIIITNKKRGSSEMKQVSKELIREEQLINTQERQEFSRNETSDSVAEWRWRDNGTDRERENLMIIIIRDIQYQCMLFLPGRKGHEVVRSRPVRPRPVMPRNDWLTVRERWLVFHIFIQGSYEYEDSVFSKSSSLFFKVILLWPHHYVREKTNNYKNSL